MKRIIYLIVSLMMVAGLVLAACAPSNGDGDGDGNGNGEPPVCETPEYGGTLTLAVPTGGTTGGDPGQDPRLDGEATGSMFEYMLRRDITTPIADAVTLDGYEGHLLESWEEVSPTHFILTLRDDVTFQNLPPVNGRGMTAYDIEYCVHRFMGLGSGYDTPSVWLNFNLQLKNMPLESVTATGDYTVEVILSEPYLHALQIFLGAFVIYPRELQDTYGETAMNDWTKLVGSGPYIADDWVADSSVRYVRNPDYWLFDWDYPANRLPYIETYEVLIIPDAQTRMAALRTGQIASLPVEDLQMAKDLREENPELNEFVYTQDSPAFMIDMNTENSAPLDDIRVRIALQKSINLEEIAEEYYDGAADPTPFGQLGEITGYNYPYAEWPEALKEEYSYDPEAAMTLLEEAGYSGGFTVDIWHPQISDESLLLLMTDYFDDIGVDSNVRTVDMISYSDRINSKTCYGLTWFYYTRFTLSPWGWVSAWHYNGNPGGWTHNYPEYDDLVEAMVAAETEEEQRQLVYECDKYAIEKHFAIITPRRGSFLFSQPWLCGMDLEGWAHIGSAGPRVWINQALKAEMT